MMELSACASHPPMTAPHRTGVLTAEARAVTTST